MTTPHKLSKEELAYIKDRVLRGHCFQSDMDELLSHIAAQEEELDRDGYNREMWKTIINKWSELCDERDQLKQAAGFCDKHKPNGGSRNCLVCATEKLSYTLSRISYICSQPNEMEVSDYSVNYNEDEVVKQVKQLKQQLEQLQCDHEWKEIDASFDHEFGTEQVFYKECQKCGLTGHSSPFSHGDEEI